MEILQKGQSKKKGASIPSRQWTKKDIKLLNNAVQMLGTNWIEVASMIPNRNANQCAQRWKRTFGLRMQQKKFWTEEEDQQLIGLVKLYGKIWGKIGELMKKRTSKQCKERYENKLDSQLKHNVYTSEEDQLIYEKFVLYGTKWSQISKEMPGRSSNQIKNRFYTFIRSKYLSIKNPYYTITQQSKQDASTELQIIRQQHLEEIQTKSFNFIQEEFQLLKENSKLDCFFKDNECSSENCLLEESNEIQPRLYEFNMNN